MADIVDTLITAAWMADIVDISSAAAGVAPCSVLEPGLHFVIRECNGSDSDALSLVEFDGRMSAELLGNENEDRLSLSFLQQVRGTLRSFMPCDPVQVVNPVRGAAFKNWHALVAECFPFGGRRLLIGACIWKLVKSGVSRYSCNGGADSGRKRGRRRLDYAELFFLYVVPEVRDCDA